jgi:hypothetical protein
VDSSSFQRLVLLFMHYRNLTICRVSNSLPSVNIIQREKGQGARECGEQVVVHVQS